MYLSGVQVLSSGQKPALRAFLGTGEAEGEASAPAAEAAQVVKEAEAAEATCGFFIGGLRAGAMSFHGAFIKVCIDKC